MRASFTHAKSRREPGAAGTFTLALLSSNILFLVPCSWAFLSSRISSPWVFSSRASLATALYLDFSRFCRTKFQ